MKLKQLNRLSVLKLKIREIILDELNSRVSTTTAETDQNSMRREAYSAAVKRTLPLTTEYYTQINNEYGGCPILYLSEALASSSGREINALLWNLQRPKHLRSEKLGYFNQVESASMLDKMPYIANESGKK